MFSFFIEVFLAPRPPPMVQTCSNNLQRGPVEFQEILLKPFRWTQTTMGPLTTTSLLPGLRGASSLAAQAQARDRSEHLLFLELIILRLPSNSILDPGIRIFLENPGNPRKRPVFEKNDGWKEWRINPWNH